MKIDSLPDPLPSLLGTMWIDGNATPARLMISDGEGFIPLVVLRKGDEPRLAALIAELAVPPLPEPAAGPRSR